MESAATLKKLMDGEWRIMGDACVHVVSCSHTVMIVTAITGLVSEANFECSETGIVSDTSYAHF